MEIRFPSTTTLAISALALSALSTTVWAGPGHADGHGDSAIGKPGVAANAKRTISIDMSDAMRFTPANINAKQGETIRFIVKNSGKLKHEFVLGTEKRTEGALRRDEEKS